MNATPALLVVLAHPDDESFRCGGTLALLARRGVRVQVLTATRGQAGSCGDPPLCRPDELPAVRECELRCACAALGIEPPILLDYQDGCLSKAGPLIVASQILDSVDRLRPQVMLTFGPDGLSGHPDHIAIGQYAAQAYHQANDVTALYTPAVPQSLAAALGLTHLRTVPDEAISLRVDVSPVWESKLAAIRCHATQASSSPITQAPVERQRAFLGTEHFVQAETRRDMPTCMDELRTL
jgi:LmbE family N-acetylglucosaminyl deacetylase